MGRLEQFPQGINLPARKEVTSDAESNNTSRDVVQQIRNAATEHFSGPEEIMQAVRGS